MTILGNLSTSQKAELSAAVDAASVANGGLGSLGNGQRRDFVALSGPAAVSTEAMIRAAAAKAIAAGGGEVIIVGDETTPITITAPLPVSSGLSYRGIKFTSWLELTGALATGTTLIGDGTPYVSPGTFNCFEFNPADKATLYSDVATMWADCIRGFGLHNLCLRGFNYGMKFGALKANGIHSPMIGNVVVEHSAYGFWLENCMQPSIARVFYGNIKTLGFCMLASMESLWHHGNGIVGQVYGQCAGGMSDLHTRGSIFGARGINSELNNIRTFNLQHNGTNTTTYNQASGPIITAGVPDIAITSNISRFAVDEIVWFGSAIGNIDSNNIYWILSKVDNGDGTGSIRIGTWEGAPSVVTPTASGNSSLSHQGATSIRIGGIGGANSLTNSRFDFIDSEAASGCAILFQCANGTYIETSIVSGQAGSVSFAMNNVQPSCGVNHRSPLVNAWVNSGGVQFMGREYTSHFGSTNAFKYRHQGILGDGTVQRLFLHSGRRNVGNRGTSASTGDASTGDVFVSDPSGYTTFTLGLALRHQHTRLASAATVAFTDGGLITYSGAGGGSVTLPAITANMVGMSLEVANPTTGTLTLNTSSSQTINGAVGVTSFTAAANSLTQLRACTADGSTFFWAVK